MEFNEVLKKRHSVRKYSDKKVPHEILEEMVMLAQTAPSSKNCKSSSFLLVEDKTILEEMVAMRDIGTFPLKGAQAAIVVMGDSSVSEAWVENASISATYLLLEAVEFGLGACWLQVRGRHKVTDDHSQGTAEDYLRKLIELPSGKEVLCVISLGYEQNND